MDGPGKRNATSKMQTAVLKVLLKICLTAFLCSLALCTGANRSGQLSSADKVVNHLAFLNDLIAENPDGLYEEGDDGTHSGKTANSDSDLLPHANSAVDDDMKVYVCSYHSDLQFSQASSYLPNGLPIFHVTFTNTCLDCAFSKIVIGCGHFTSGILVNPAIFRSLGNNFCLLNDGKPVPPQSTIIFDYMSTFKFPMTVLRANSSCAAN